MYKSISSPAIDHLKQYPNWVCQGDDKTYPINPNTGSKAKSNDVNTHGTYEQCMTYIANNWQNIPNLLPCLVLQKHMGIVGVDLDDDPNLVFFDGKLTKWASDVINLINSYSELSRNEGGVHILAFGEIPRAIGSKKIHGVEMYQHGKVWTMTGKHLPYTPNTIEHRHSELIELHKQYAPHIYEPKPVRNYQHSDSVPSTDQIADMLSFIPLPLGYEEWINICMSVHSVYPNDDGFHLVLNWSSGHFKEGENESLSMRNKWRSFKGNGIGIGTLFHFAKQYGWIPPNDQSIQIDEPLEPDTKPVEPSKPEIVIITQDELQKRLDDEYWRGYHDGMTDSQRQSWLKTGISDNVLDFVIDEFRLGFRPETIDTATGEVKPDCLSIPYFTGENTLNIEYRDINTGRITYELDTPTLYNTVNELPRNHVCLLDDSVDSIKAWLQYGTVGLGGNRLQFMSLPQHKLTINSLDVLDSVDCIHVVLSKLSKVKDRGLELLKGRARFVKLPTTFDDVCQCITPNEFVSLLSTGDKW